MWLLKRLCYLSVNVSDDHVDGNDDNANKAIVDYTSPALCTPVTSFPLIGDAAYHQHAGGGPSHRHRQHAQKNW